jgi:hypothetical protein
MLVGKVFIALLFLTHQPALGKSCPIYMAIHEKYHLSKAGLQPPPSSNRDGRTMAIESLQTQSLRNDQAKMQLEHEGEKNLKELKVEKQERAGTPGRAPHGRESRP